MRMAVAHVAYQGYQVEGASIGVWVKLVFIYDYHGDVLKPPALQSNVAADDVSDGGKTMKA